MDTTSNQLTDTYCSSTCWDVFLSFYGKDTRRNFIANLYFALDQAGIKTFRDDHALEKGEEISSGLVNAIKNSKMFVVVISKNYARSPWCLNELVQILSCKRTNNQIVPVFYYVDPSDLRYLNGSFGEALKSQKSRHSVDTMEKWRSALAKLADFSGYHLKKDTNVNESDTIREIVEIISPQTSMKVLHLEKYLVGIHSTVKEIYQKLIIKADEDDIRAIGICGMGGIGKTTSAKAFYNKYSNQFDISCFIENEKKNLLGGNPLLPLLEQLLMRLLRRKDYKVTDIGSGIRRLKQILYSKKALIVLDDWDRSSYSGLLVRLHSLFSAGSRIIITTRDANLLNQLKVDMSAVDIHMMRKLGRIDSLELFSYHAFRKSMPPEGFRELSLGFVNYAGGLPLALKVLGSSLCGRTDVSFWKAKLKKVQEIPENEIHKILKLSYDELGDETEKSIFLDIAFFFVGKNKDEAVHIFNSCDFFPDVGIPTLVERCLLTIDEDNRFQMHNIIQDMGRELGKSTRLLWQRNARKDLQNLEGTHNIEGLILDVTMSTEKQITTDIFKRLPNLRLLEIIDAHDIKGNFENSFHELRCIRWHYCPWTRLPSSFRPQKLISLDMSFSKFKTLCKAPMPVKYMPNLSRLDLCHCYNLKQLPEQLGDMKGLKMLDVSYTAIEQLPDSIAHLKELVELRLFSCNLKRLPEQMGDMKGLKILDASYTAIEKLPDSIAQLKELVELRLFSCKKLRKLPEQFGNIKGLRSFTASCSAIEQLPDSFVGLINLVGLHLSNCINLASLPNSIWKLELLKVLDLGGSSKLKRLPEQLGKMQCLEELNASCTAIEELPDSIGLLSRLEVLNFNWCEKLKYLPNSIGNLTSLTNLYLPRGHNFRTNLPETFKNMRLECLSLRCDIRLWLPVILSFSSLNILHLANEDQSFSSTRPFSLSKLSNLQYLTLENCISHVYSFPELPPNLKDLSLYNHTTLEELPDLSSLGQLKNLFILNCISLKSLPPLPPHLQSLEAHECTSLQEIPDLSILTELEALSFIGCNNLKSVSLKQSCLQVGHGEFSNSFRAALPNREIAEWFSNRGSGCTVSFQVPLILGDNFLGVALWVVYKCCVVYKCKLTDFFCYIRAVITNKTAGTTDDYHIYAPIDSVGEVRSMVKCIRGDTMSIKSGDKIKVSFQRFLYCSSGDVELPYEVVKVEMCGAHVIQKTP